MLLLLVLVLVFLGDGGSSRRHLAEHRPLAPRRPSPRDNDDVVADLAFDSRRDRYSAINPSLLSSLLCPRRKRIDVHSNYFVRSSDFSKSQCAGEYNLQSTSSSPLLSFLISRSPRHDDSRGPPPPPLLAFESLLFFASRLFDNHYRDKNVLLIRGPRARKRFFDEPAWYSSRARGSIRTTRIDTTGKIQYW